MKGKKIDANDLLEVLGNMGIELTEKDFVKLKQTVPIDGEPYKCQGSLSGELGSGGHCRQVYNIVS